MKASPLEEVRHVSSPTWKVVEGASKVVEGASKVMKGAWKGVEGAWKGVEGRGRSWKGGGALRLVTHRAMQPHVAQPEVVLLVRRRLEQTPQPQCGERVPGLGSG